MANNGKTAKRNRYDNPKTDKFEIIKFHHLEVTCSDALSTMKLIKQGLGMEIVAESKKETGNHSYCSYVLNTHDVKFIVTAPYLADRKHPQDNPPNPKYDSEKAKTFYTRHGTGVSAVAIEVKNAREAYEIATKNGAKGVLPPLELTASEAEGGGKVIISEIDLYGDYIETDPSYHSDTVIRFMSFDGFKGAYLPGYRTVKDPYPLDYGITKMDHVVGNVWNMERTINNLKNALGLHTFAAFTKEDIATPWTSLNSEVLSSNNERVLFPVNEPAPGKKESQITEYLKAYNGPGVQHIALKTSNILAAVKAMRDRSDVGFEFMTTPKTYYENPEIAHLMKENLTPEEIDAVIELSILIDKDDEGMLLQIFTKPLFDRPTIFVEIIQRKCAGETIEIPGCGGFGKGNFKALFEAIERMQEERGGLLDTTNMGKPC
jgi:4-hydroxyphenylpyruvate dioxygenase